MPRGIWNGTLSFGLVAVPVRMVSATRDEDVHFHQVDERTGERIEVQRICEADGEQVAWEDVAHGYDLDGELVVLTDEELAAAAPERTHTIEIEQFSDLDEIDPASFDRQYFLIPDSDSQGVLRAYRLLRDAMADTGRAAIGRVVIRSSEYVVAVRERDGLLALSTLLFADELRHSVEIDAVPTDEDGTPGRGEVTQAVKLIEAMSGDFEPERYENRHRDRLLNLVERKRKSKKDDIADELEEEPVETDSPSAAPDLMAALKESLARARG